MRKAQQRVLAWLAGQEELGDIPNFREAARELGYASPSSVHRLIAALAEQGFIEKGSQLGRCRLSEAGWRELGRSSPAGGLPVLGAIAAGSPILAEEHIIDQLPDLRPGGGRFALRVRGDSMIEAHIHDGDYAIIDPQREVLDGGIGAVLIDDEATLKRIHFSSRGLRLLPANPAYAEIVLDHDTGTCRILGALQMVVRTW